MFERANFYKIRTMNVTELELDEYVTDILIHKNIKTVEDVVSYTKEEMLNILGSKADLGIVQEKLELLGVEFKYKAIDYKGDETPIEDLDVSVRSYNILRGCGITTIADLVYADSNKMNCLRKKGTLFFKELLMSLYEKGFNMIDVENEKMQSLQEALNTETAQGSTSIETIAIENVEVNKYCDLEIACTTAPSDKWIEVFNEMQTQYFSKKCYSSKSRDCMPENLAQRLVCEIRLTPASRIFGCPAKEIMESENYKEILACFVEYINDILKLTNEEYAKRMLSDVIKSKQLEIEGILKNIELINSVLEERNKILAINDELRALLEDAKN